VSCLQIRRTMKTATQAYAPIGILMRGWRRTTFGYLLTCPRTGTRPGSVQAPGSSLSFRLPALVAWLSFGLRGPGAVMGQERLKRGLRSSK
jgi:hypothetical protein